MSKLSRYSIKGEKCYICGGEMLVMEKYRGLYQVVCICTTLTSKQYTSLEEALIA